DVEHLVVAVEALHGTHGDTVGEAAALAVSGDDEGHARSLASALGAGGVVYHGLPASPTISMPSRLTPRAARPEPPPADRPLRRPTASAGDTPPFVLAPPLARTAPVRGHARRRSP